MNKEKKRIALAASAALLICGCAGNSTSEAKSIVTKESDGSEMGQCHGQNSCKGSSSCATASNACASKNSCKGTGWIPLSKSDCDTRGGQFKGFKPIT